MCSLFEATSYLLIFTHGTIPQMDPLTIVGVAGAIVGVIDVITRSVRSLCNLQTKFKGSDLTISLLIGQLSTLKAALYQINEWIDTSLVTVQQRQRVVLDLNASLESCKVVIQLLDDRVSHFEKINDNAMCIQSRVLYLWEQTGITEYLNHLNNQTVALNLLLTALQWLVHHQIFRSSINFTNDGSKADQFLSKDLC